MIPFPGILMALTILLITTFLDNSYSQSTTQPAFKNNHPLLAHDGTNSSRLEANFASHSHRHIAVRTANMLNLSGMQHTIKRDISSNENSSNFAIGKIIPCTNEEKICLSHGMLFLPKLEICDDIGFHLDRRCSVKIDEQEFTNMTGHVIGLCETDVNSNPTSGTLSTNPCYQWYDGKCHSKPEIHNICGCDNEPIPHVFRGYECNCEEHAPVQVEQPDEDGLCHIPDLRYPDYSVPHSVLQDPQRSFNCSDNQVACFRQKKIWVTELQNCFSPGERGSCPEDHVVVLNELAAGDGIAEGACVHVTGTCPIGHKRLVFDRKCYSDRELQIRKINVRIQPFGNYDEHVWEINYNNYSGSCDIFYPPPMGGFGVITVVAVPGASVKTDSGGISAVKVEANVPNPSSLP